MTCQNCGADMNENDAFCPSCGARNAPVPSDSGGLQEMSGPVRERKKKVNVRGIIYAVLGVVVAVMAVYELVQANKTDYIGSVKQYYTPFEEIGYTGTCGQVFGRYMPEADWTVREDGGSGLVKVRGPFGAASELEVSITVEPVEGEKDMAYYNVVSGVLDGEFLSRDEVLNGMALMWDAYSADLTREEFEEYYG